MKRGLLAGMALVLMLATPVLAAHRGGDGGDSHWGGEHGEGDDGSFSLATLQGTYIFEASGFMDDGAVGSVGVLGTLTFDGIGGVMGNLTMTVGDTGQWSCNDNFTTVGSYTLPTPTSGPGLGTLTLPAAGGNSINFNIVVPSTEGRSAQAVESENAAPTAIICTGVPALKSMVLKGHLRRIGWDDGD